MAFLDAQVNGRDGRAVAVDYLDVGRVREVVDEFECRIATDDGRLALEAG